MLGGPDSAPTACQREKWSAKHEKGRGSVPGQARLNPLWPRLHTALKWHQKGTCELQSYPETIIFQKKKSDHKSPIPGSDTKLIRLLSCLKLRKESKCKSYGHLVNDWEWHAVSCVMPQQHPLTLAVPLTTSWVMQHIQNRFIHNFGYLSSFLCAPVPCGLLI